MWQIRTRSILTCLSFVHPSISYRAYSATSVGKVGAGLEAGHMISPSLREGSIIRGLEMINSELQTERLRQVLAPHRLTLFAIEYTVNELWPKILHFADENSAAIADCRVLTDFSQHLEDAPILYLTRHLAIEWDALVIPTDVHDLFDQVVHMG